MAQAGNLTRVLLDNPGALAEGLSFHFVHTAEGSLSFRMRDLAADGPIPIIISRVYDSADTSGDSCLGKGWRLTYDETAVLDSLGLTLHLSSGKVLRFPRNRGGYDPAVTEPSTYRVLEMRSDGDEVAFALADGRIKRFRRVGGVYCLSRIEDSHNNWVALDWVKGRLGRLSRSSGASVELAYNADGTLSSASDSAGRTVRYQYERRRLVGMAGEGGTAWAFRYGAQGLEAVVPPGGQPVLAATYDKTGRVQSVQDEDGTVYIFAYNGPATQAADVKSRTVSFRHNQSGVVTSVTNADGVETAVTMDSRNRVSEYRVNGATRTHYEYDPDGRIGEIYIPGKGSYFYGYDHDGRLVYNEWPNGQFYILERDGAGGMVRVRDKDGLRCELTRDNNGEVVAFRHRRGDNWRLNPAAARTAAFRAATLPPVVKNHWPWLSATGPDDEDDTGRWWRLPLDTPALPWAGLAFNEDQAVLRIAWPTPEENLWLGFLVQSGLMAALQSNTAASGSLKGGNMNDQDLNRQSGSPTTDFLLGFSCTCYYDDFFRSRGCNGIPIEMCDNIDWQYLPMPMVPPDDDRNPTLPCISSILGGASQYVSTGKTKIFYGFVSYGYIPVWSVYQGASLVSTFIGPVLLYSFSEPGDYTVCLTDTTEECSPYCVQVTAFKVEIQTVELHNDSVSFTTRDGENQVHCIADIKPDSLDGSYNSQIRWEIDDNPNENGDSGDPPNPETGNDIQLTIVAPAASSGRGFPLSYRIKALLTIGNETFESQPKYIKQDDLDKCRQEYIDMSKNPVPGRDEFVSASTYSDPGHFSFSEINTSDYPNWAIFHIAGNLEAVRTSFGHGMSVNSGYRNPIRNDSLSGSSSTSRHMWGDAADIHVADFNGDGKIDKDDWQLLADAATTNGASLESYDLTKTWVHMGW